MKNKQFSYLEWEFLEEPIVISKINATEKLPQGKKEIKVFRDDHYMLNGIITGKEDPYFFQERKFGLPGENVDQFNISGSDYEDYYKYSIQFCFLGESKVQTKEEDTNWKVNIKMFSIKRTNINENKADTLIDWYLNGPNQQIFCHSTKRDFLYKYIRERSITIDEILHSLEAENSKGSTDFDFIKLNAFDNTFLITRVPKEYGPIWSNNIGIEYKNKWGKIPSEEERIMIFELCSFIFGCQLLQIGYTLYDEENNLVEEYACNPWGTYPKTLCSIPDAPPIRIDRPIFSTKAENLINYLLPLYKSYKKSYNLNDGLWLYWLARIMPLGSQLPIYSSAIESLMNGWFKSENSESHGKFIEDKEFEELLKYEINLIKEKIENKKNEIRNKPKLTQNDVEKGAMYDGILKRLNLINKMGVMDRFRRFFKEIELDITDLEWETIKARSNIAHGRIETQDDQIEKQYQFAMTYDTLFHKVILKLLGYSGDYIDRSIIGWKDKTI